MKDTLGNEQWLRDNEVKIRELLPPTWTHMENLNCLKIGFGLKLLGIDWRSKEEFGRVMVFLEKIGMLQRRNVYQIRRDEHQARLGRHGAHHHQQTQPPRTSRGLARQAAALESNWACWRNSKIHHQERRQTLRKTPQKSTKLLGSTPRILWK